MSEVYEFEGFRLDVGEHVLERAGSGERVAIPDKAFETLCILVKNSGRLMSKDELLSQVWADAFVEENNLNKSIYAVRRALGENKGEQRFIETVKKHGYRFVPEVRSVTGVEISGKANAVTSQPGPSSLLSELEREPERPDLQPAGPESHGRRPVERAKRPDLRRNFAVVIVALILALGVGALLFYKYSSFASTRGERVPSTLAVLPLKPLNASDNYLGLGMADAIIRRISQMGTLTVRPTSSVRRYLADETDALEAAKALGVDAVLEGTVQRADDRLRVSVNLLRTSDGKSMWADNFDMAATDVFTIQDSVAQQVAGSLRLRLDPQNAGRLTAGYTSNALAYEYYLKGIYSFEQRGFTIENKSQHDATIALFKKAVEADPNYALAHAQLAYAYAWMAVYIDSDAQPEWVKLAKEEMYRADILDTHLAETHIARQHILLSANEGFQLEAATHEALLARQINPNVGIPDLAADFLHLGLEDLFEAELQRSLAVDPTGDYNKLIFSILYSNARRYDDWMAFRQKYLDGRPDAQYLLGTGRLDEAEQEIGKVLAKSSNDTFILGCKAILAALRGDKTGAESQIPALISKMKPRYRGYHHDTYNIACTYALIGKNAEALKWLRETANSGLPSYPLFERDHYLDGLRQTPEFAQFMAEMKARHEALLQEFAGSTRS